MLNDQNCSSSVKSTPGHECHDWRRTLPVERSMTGARDDNTEEGTIFVVNDGNRVRRNVALECGREITGC